MKYLITLVLLLSLASLSCKKDEEEDENVNLDAYCDIIPNGWECNIIYENFNQDDIAAQGKKPVGIIKYRNPGKEYFVSESKKRTPSLILNFYNIKSKNGLINFIDANATGSFCIPVEYGENEDFFIISSPCFINNGSFSKEAKASIRDLHDALGKLIKLKNNGLI